MSEIWSSTLSAYWSATEVSANLAIFLTLLGALLLGLVVGYERTYHGRAVGMRTYGLVCMASAALTTFVGYPTLWYGGHAATVGTVDPTRVVQGIVTGIGFLGAGIIMKDGLAEWHFVAICASKSKHAPLAELAQLLGGDARVDSFQLAHTRN